MQFCFEMLREGTVQQVTDLFYNHPWFQVLWAAEGTRVSPNSKNVYWQKTINPNTVIGLLNVHPEISFLPMPVLPLSSESGAVVARQWTSFHCEGNEFGGCGFPKESSRSRRNKPHQSALELRKNCYGRCTVSIALSLLDTVSYGGLRFFLAFSPGFCVATNQYSNSAKSRRL
jgi:hypothetical protein